jgi:stress response protein YsnF
LGRNLRAFGDLNGEAFHKVIMSDQLRVPIVEEEAHLLKHKVAREHVSVRTSTEDNQVVVRDLLKREHIDVTRVPKDEEVAQAPAVRVEGDVTIVSVLEERLVVEKRLFLVEELHLRRTVQSDEIAVPTTLRRTRVEIERDDLSKAGEN